MLCVWCLVLVCLVVGMTAADDQMWLKRGNEIIDENNVVLNQYQVGVYVQKCTDRKDEINRTLSYCKILYLEDDLSDDIKETNMDKMTYTAQAEFGDDTLLVRLDEGVEIDQPTKSDNNYVLHMNISMSINGVEVGVIAKKSGGGNGAMEYLFTSSLFSKIKRGDIWTISGSSPLFNVRKDQETGTCMCRSTPSDKCTPFGSDKEVEVIATQLCAVFRQDMKLNCYNSYYCDLYYGNDTVPGDKCIGLKYIPEDSLCFDFGFGMSNIMLMIMTTLIVALIL